MSTLSFQVPTTLIEQIDQEVVRTAAETNLQVSRSNLVRTLLGEALAARKKGKPRK